MNANQHVNPGNNLLLKTLAAWFSGNCGSLSERNYNEFSQLMRLSSDHKLLPLVIDSLHGYEEAESWQEYAQYKRMARMQVTEQARRGIEFLEVYEKLREAGISALVVKGCVCRSVWPKGHLRVSADEDLYVRPADFKRACDVLRNEGLICNENAAPELDFEIGWKKPNSTLYIELHQKLFSPESGAICDLQRFFDDVFDHVKQYSVENGAGSVLSMSPEDHLLYLILHAYKHFVRSGFGIRQVCDIGLWMKVYGNEIDHARLMSKLSEARALYFAAAIFAIAKQDLGIALQLPPCWDEIGIDREPMLQDLLDAGVYGSSTMSRHHSAALTAEAVAASRGNRKKRGLLYRAFPPKRILARDYPELNEHPAKLPLIWVKRLLKYQKETKADENNSMAESIRIARNREELLKCYHII